jgi:hypothetical protein
MKKSSVVTACPVGVITLTRPDPVNVGTTNVAAVLDAVRTAAAVAFNRTADSGVRFVPVMVTVSPATPIAGDMVAIVGAVAVWFVTATEMLPVTVAAGSTATT